MANDFQIPDGAKAAMDALVAAFSVAEKARDAEDGAVVAEVAASGAYEQAKADHAGLHTAAVDALTDLMTKAQALVDALKTK